MAYIQGFVLILCLVLCSSLRTQARVLTREELLPLLTKQVVIPNRQSLETPKPTPWPEEFTISFTTDDGAATGVLVYDWGNKQQAIIHGRGASHCVARGSKGMCYILENPKGTFEVDPVGENCELTFPDVGSVPPTWVSHGVFAGVEDVKGVKCNRFNFPPTMHAWLETVDGGLPCAFLFPYAPLNYYFDAGSLKLGQPALSTFRIPEYCPREEKLREGSLKADQ